MSAVHAAGHISSLRSMEVIKSSRILLPEGLFSGYICVRDGKIVAIEGEFNESTMDLSKVQIRVRTAMMY